MTKKTRQQRAIELRDRLKRGPAFSANPGREYTQAQACDSYRLWSDTWIMDELIDLIPELRKASK